MPLHTAALARTTSIRGRGPSWTWDPNLNLKLNRDFLGSKVPNFVVGRHHEVNPLLTGGSVRPHRQPRNRICRVSAAPEGRERYRVRSRAAPGHPHSLINSSHCEHPEHTGRGLPHPHRQELYS